MFELNCSSCHGADASGTDRAPNLQGLGPATVDFWVSTGRMPLAVASAQPVQKPPGFTRKQTLQIVAFVNSLAPAAPDYPLGHPQCQPVGGRPAPRATRCSSSTARAATPSPARVTRSSNGFFAPSLHKIYRRADRRGDPHRPDPDAALRAGQPLEPASGRHRQVRHAGRSSTPPTKAASGSAASGPWPRASSGCSSGWAGSCSWRSGSGTANERRHRAPSSEHRRGRRATAPPAGLPVTKFDDPHLQPYAKNPRRAEMLIGVLLLLGLAGFCAYGGLYWVGGQTQWEAVFGGVGFFAFGFGLSAWGKYLLPQGPFVEERHDLALDRARGRGHGGRHRGPGQDGVPPARLPRHHPRCGGRGDGHRARLPPPALAGPTAAEDVSTTTNWQTGSNVVDLDGKRIHQADLEVGGALTVFPEGFAGSSVDQTMLIRAGRQGHRHAARPRDLGSQGVPGVLQAVHPRRLPGGPVRRGSPEAVVPVSPVAVQRARGGQAGVRPGPPPPAAAAAQIDSGGFLRGPGRL